jgi:transposase-like protein
MPDKTNPDYVFYSATSQMITKRVSSRKHKELSMPRNPVQFQKGMSDADFDQLYGTEEQCRNALFTWRWPKGFTCPICGGNKHSFIATRNLFQCSTCRSQVSLIAGTIFHSTKLPLKTWFRAIYHITQSKGGISSLELARRLGVTQNTAWKVSHKLMQVMHEREETKPLTGRIEMDDAYIGGKRKGKRGRGAAGKAPFVAAVETTDDGKPQRMKLRPVSGFTSPVISKVSASILTGECRVVTDGLPCFTAVSRQGFTHIPLPTNGNKSLQDSTFKWVNTILGNVKCALVGTYRAISCKHVPRYLSSFAYRFNRRFCLPDMFDRLAYVALRTPPMPYRLLKLAEEST